jgi:hypothetical protein
MLTQQSVKDLLYSLPMPVEMAGFRSDTMALAKSGWDLSMKQHYNMYHEYELQLAIRHGDMKYAIYGLSNPIILPHGETRRFFSSPFEYSKFFNEYGFNIGYMSNDIRVVAAAPMRGMSFSQFEPIDCIPQQRFLEESIREIKFFKTVNHSVRDLIVSPDQVPELLDLVLRSQANTQENIRARERSRANFEAYKSGEVFKPAHEVHAQIITLAV